MAKTSQDKKHFHWSNKVSNENQAEEEKAPSCNPCHHKDKDLNKSPSPLTRKKFQTLTIARFRIVLTSLRKNRPNLLYGLGPQVIGTLFRSRRGHVHFAFQKNPTSQPAFLIELQTPISGLVKEMAYGLVRIALECDKDDKKIKKVGNSRKLLEEGVLRTFCNGKNCGLRMESSESCRADLHGSWCVACR
ncbi:unnamed protein product [Lactuca saligna]|uniref:Uncharacterized protein n=1 Tax=Lactuca saligna TaxID=75948 RepID=A0AA35Z115_LACSI|nr:unnamed protein product [Lactuca saligna]